MTMLTREDLQFEIARLLREANLVENSLVGRLAEFCEDAMEEARGEGLIDGNQQGFDEGYELGYEEGLDDGLCS